MKDNNLIRQYVDKDEEQLECITWKELYSRMMGMGDDDSIVVWRYVDNKIGWKSCRIVCATSFLRSRFRDCGKAWVIGFDGVCDPYAGMVTENCGENFIEEYISEYNCSNDDDTFYVDKETRNESNTASDADKILEYDDICMSAFDVKGALEMLVSELEEKPTLLEIPIICEFAENIYSAGRTAAVIERVSKYHPYSWPKDGKYLDSLCNKITKLIDDVLYADKK